MTANREIHIKIKGEEVILDLEDLHLIYKYSWSFDKDGYLFSTTCWRETGYSRFHRFILKAPEEVLTDHVNRNIKDNRKSNLRLCNESQSIWNRRSSQTEYIGVTQIPSGNWCVAFNERRYGTYSNLNAALNCYNFNATRIYGEFASLNPVSEYMDFHEWMSFRVCLLRGMVGTSWDRRIGKWTAFVYPVINGKRKRTRIGSFYSEEEAIEARNKYIKENMSTS